MMKGQKGITLVALIITIIVMLILVAVTISIALSGGLFDKARTASKETRIAQIKEAIALAKADIIADYYDPTNKTASANHATTYLGTAPDAGTAAPNDDDPVANAINQYLDKERVSVKVSGSEGTYTVTVDTSSINTDLTDFSEELVFDIWTAT